MKNNEFKTKLGLIFISAAVFFTAAYPFKRFFTMIPGITEIRPANMAAPVLGIMFGIYGSVGTVIGNLAADLAAGAETKAWLIGIPINLFYSYAPYVMWHASEKKSSPPAMKSVNEIIRYIVIMLAVSSATAAMLSLFTLFSQGGSFWASFVMLLFNNFDFAVLLGVPVLFIAGKTKIPYIIPREDYRRFAPYSGNIIFFNEKNKPTLQSKFLLFFLFSAVFYIVFIAFHTYEMCREMTFFDRWSKILIVTGITSHIVFIGSLAFLSFTEKRLVIPIEELAAASESFALKCRRGENITAFHTSANGSGEIAMLACSFEFMTEEIVKYMRELKITTAEKEYFKAELDIAAKIQSGFLPEGRSFEYGCARAEIYAYMKAAKEVGGDTYDFFMTDDSHIALLIADASGKGISAAMFISAGRQIIKSEASAGKSPSEVLEAANRRLCGENGADMFITAWLGILDIGTGRLEYANAAHNPPILMHKDSCGYIDSKPNVFLAGFENTAYSNERICLENGDTLILYTDGIVEAYNEKSELFGEERLTDILTGVEFSGPEMVSKKILQGVSGFVGSAEQSDDMTMLIVRRKLSDRITLAADRENIPKLISFAEDWLKRMNCPPRIITDFCIALDEIAANICMYAYNVGKKGDISVKCVHCRRKNQFSFIIADSGVPFNPLKAPAAAVTGSSSERSVGGLGIHIVRQLMEEVGYKYTCGSNILKISKSL